MDSENNEEKTYPLGYQPEHDDLPGVDPRVQNQLLNFILQSSPETAVDTDIFSVMAKRRSTRKFSDKIVETAKIDKIISAADTAPTAGNFQGFEIFYIKSPEKKNASCCV